ncbi:MAG: ATP-binding cassette domain-containing protein [Bacteroidota bacterium]
MVAIELKSIGKKFNRNWLFKEVNLHFAANKSYALTGFNGSGKSTLLQLIYGYQVPSAGSVEYTEVGETIAPEAVYKHISFVAPYVELPEELSLLEVLQFHFSFKVKSSAVSNGEMIAAAGLQGSEHKQIRYFSSGMKQRLKLMLAFYTQCDVLLLDEPCSNLDEGGIDWYRKMMLEQKGKRTILIASNQQSEYDFCDTVYAVTDFKPSK